MFGAGTEAEKFLWHVRAMGSQAQGWAVPPSRPPTLWCMGQITDQHTGIPQHMGALVPL